jgi:5'-nucleotidase (lipoprotein e(P4) family)
MEYIKFTKERVILMLAITVMLFPGFAHTAKAQALPDQSVMGVLWFQRSAEYRALCYQAYNLAEMRVKEYLADPVTGKTAVVIFDIDETLLDNSPQEALNILDGISFNPERWKAWTDRAVALPIPGSLDFCHFLARNGIHPIYVSNRLTSECTGTLLNLQKWNFPYADRNHLYLKSDVSSKEIRRLAIEKMYHVLLLVGDNLSDFDQVFEDRSVNFGFNTVDSLRADFGKKFIVLPNPMYGDWTKPITGDRKDWLVR